MNLKDFIVHSRLKGPQLMFKDLKPGELFRFVSRTAEQGMLIRVRSAQPTFLNGDEVSGDTEGWIHMDGHNVGVVYYPSMKKGGLELEVERI